MQQSDQSHGLHPWAVMVNHVTTLVTHKYSQVTSCFNPKSVSSHLPCCPPVNTRQVSIKIFDLDEGVVCLHTARNPAEEGPLPGRVTGAYIAVFPHGLLDTEVLLAVRAGEGLICFWPVDPMNNLMMLLHALPACIMPPTVRTLDRLPLGCKQVGEPIACTLMPEPCHICCMDTSLHGAPPCASSACGGWAAPSHTQGTPWHPSPLQTADMPLQPLCRPQPLQADLPLSGEPTPAVSSSSGPAS